jgi:hypothetical protein
MGSGALTMLYAILLQICYVILLALSYLLFFKLLSSKADEAKLYTDIFGQLRLVKLITLRLLPLVQMGLMLL